MKIMTYSFTEKTIKAMRKLDHSKLHLMFTILMNLAKKGKPQTFSEIARSMKMEYEQRTLKYQLEYLIQLGLINEVNKHFVPCKSNEESPSVLRLNTYFLQRLLDRLDSKSLMWYFNLITLSKDGVVELRATDRVQMARKFSCLSKLSEAAIIEDNLIKKDLIKRSLNEQNTKYYYSVYNDNGELFSPLNPINKEVIS